jgi:hypothetical protein
VGKEEKFISEKGKNHFVRTENEAVPTRWVFNDTAKYNKTAEIVQKRYYKVENIKNALTSEL